MKTTNIRLHLCAGAIVLASALGAVSAQAEAYTVRLENLTRGQHFTPPIFAMHAAGNSFFTLGEAASTALTMMAEGGDTAMLAAAITSAIGVSGTAGGPVAPGKMVEVCVDTGSNATFNRLSLAGMLLPTNDGFVAINAQEVPADGGTWLLNAYDAGSEGNSELTADIPKPPFITGAFDTGTGGSNTISEAAGEGRVHIHRGVIGDTNATGGASDVNASVHRWLNPIARVSVSVAAGACPSGS